MYCNADCRGKNLKKLPQNEFSELIVVQREYLTKIETVRRNLTFNVLTKSVITLDIQLKKLVNIKIFDDIYQENAKINSG